MSIPSNIENAQAKKGRLLVVEDDTHLRDELAKIIENRTAFMVDKAECAEHARQLVNNQVTPYVLGLLDVMLPTTLDDFTRIEEVRSDLDSMRVSLRNLARKSDQESKKQLRNERHTRASLLSKIDHHIDSRAGIDLANEWRTSGNDKLCFPILFLSAIGEQRFVREGLELHGGLVKWIVKPATAEDIISACESLLNEARNNKS